MTTYTRLPPFTRFASYYYYLLTQRKWHVRIRACPFRYYSVLWEPALPPIPPASCYLACAVKSHLPPAFAFVCLYACHFSIWPYVSDSPRFDTSPHIRGFPPLPLLDLVPSLLLPARQHLVLCFHVSSLILFLVAAGTTELKMTNNRWQGSHAPRANLYPSRWYLTGDRRTHGAPLSLFLLS
ncbi:hypothetical protein M440DRAFT_178767 [Trichoderma longibrachiatum ATCC 18648]|uniref:Uncharacterized protein n=1 Tax=Trichoderma longibrachiatum ATCC 18648 TaxID=983965 RepID=A0A2T4CER3_TRILO|nr:hypothetical protein M440DRAFT_178767 [Trichoderma longibrachiatum ATCC 18648]